MKNFFKKPLNLVSFLMAVLGLVGVIVMLVVPHGGKYTRKYEVADKKAVSVVKLSDGKIYTREKIDGKWLTEDYVLLGEYDIDSKKISYKVGAASVEFGKINSFKYVSHIGENEYTCKMTVAFFAIACVMLIAGSLGLVYAGATSKAKKSKPKAKAKKK